MVRIRAAGGTDSGMIREVNEDAWLFDEDAGDALALVVDGMGGMSSGRAAAELTVAACEAVFGSRIADYAEAWWRAEHTPPAIAWAELPSDAREVIEARVREIRSSRVPATPGDLAILEAEGDVVATVARRCLVAANLAVAKRSAEDVTCRGIGAAAVAAVFGRGVVGIAHVGDSRCYVLRDGALKQLTTDHTLLNVVLEQQAMTPEEIEAFPHKSVITRALGFGDVEVDTRTLETRAGDIFLLCSDGISNTFDEKTLRQMLARGCEAAALLIEEAHRSSRDNATAVVVEAG
jgi:protein phosphatase